MGLLSLSELAKVFGGLNNQDATQIDLAAVLGEVRGITIKQGAGGNGSTAITGLVADDYLIACLIGTTNQALHLVSSGSASNSTADGRVVHTDQDASNKRVTVVFYDQTGR